MPDLNAHRETLESWKQIAAYLKRSERTVRRWESREGLPVHRHGHQSQDTVFAHVDEIDRWMKRRTSPARPDAVATTSEPKEAAAETGRNRPGAPNRYLAEHDAITCTIDCYIAGGRAGDSELMRPAFHPDATLAGYCQGVEYSGSIQHLFDWIDANGPAPNIQPRFRAYRSLRDDRHRPPGSAGLLRTDGRNGFQNFRGVHAVEARWRVENHAEDISLAR
jgi:hypothetical protein